MNKFKRFFQAQSSNHFFHKENGSLSAATQKSIHFSVKHSFEDQQ